MSTEHYLPISRDCALRIGLAQRMLPGVSLSRLMEILIGRLGTPLTTESLASLRLKDLRQGLKQTQAAGEEGDEFAREQLDKALACLCGEQHAQTNLPTVERLAPEEMRDSIRVAVASNGGESLDGHFASCARFLVYQVSATAVRLVDIREAQPPGDVADRNAWRAALLRDCHLLYVVSIGGPAAAKVVRAGTHPVKFPEGGPARGLLERLQQVLKVAPPPWLARAMGREPVTLARFGLPS